MSSEPELYIVPRFWDDETIKFNEEGFEGWMIFGILGFFNFLYYSDMFINKYVMTASFNDIATTPFNNIMYGGVGSAFWSGLGFKSAFGIGQWVRVFLNWTAWFVVMFTWCLTLIPHYYIAEVWLFNIGAYFMGTLHLIRTAFLVITWCLAIAIYNDYTNFYRVYDYFGKQDAWGHRMTPKYADVSGHSALAMELGFIDYELELATCIGLFVGIPLLAPRYHAALKKVESRKEEIQNEYLNNERKWAKLTEQKIAIEKAMLAAKETNASEKASSAEGSSAMDASVDEEETKEW